MASDIWLRTILIVRKETRCRRIYSYRLTARVILYAPSHRQDNTYHGLCYTSRGALAGTRNSSMGPPHEGSTRRPIAPWANALPLSYVPLPVKVSANAYTGNIRSGSPPVDCERLPFLVITTPCFVAHFEPWARCSFVVRAIAHGAVGRRIDPSWWTHLAIARTRQCSTTGVTKAVVCVISCLWYDAHKNVAYVAAASFLSLYMSGPLPYVWGHITVNFKMCLMRR